MKQDLKTTTLGTALLLSLLLNGYFLSKSESVLEKNAFCAQFKEQVAKRISTYYLNKDEENIYPNEIFYSKSRKSCIALWTNIKFYSGGYNTTEVILDPVTNEEILSLTFQHSFTTNPLPVEVEIDMDRRKLYSDLVLKLKGTN